MSGPLKQPGQESYPIWVISVSVFLLFTPFLLLTFIIQLFPYVLETLFLGAQRSGSTAFYIVRKEYLGSTE